MVRQWNEGLPSAGVHGIKPIGDTERFQGGMPGNISGHEPVHMGWRIRTFMQQQHQVPGKSILNIEPVHVGMLPAEAGCRRSWSV